MRIPGKPVPQASEKVWNAIRPWASRQDLAQFILRDRCVQGIGIGPGEPVAALAEQPVTGLGVTLQVPGFQKVVQPEQDGNVDLTWRLTPVGQALTPAAQPVFAEGVSCCLAEASMHRFDQRRGIGQVLEGLQMEVEIRGTSRTDADGVHPGSLRQNRSLKTIGCNGEHRSLSR